MFAYVGSYTTEKRRGRGTATGHVVHTGSPSRIVFA